MRAGRKQKGNTLLSVDLLEVKAWNGKLIGAILTLIQSTMLLWLLLSAFRCLGLLYQPIIDYIIKHSSCSSRKVRRILAYYERITLGMLMTQFLPNNAIV